MDGEIQEMELPPLARRILHFRSAAFENVGITPARAGNTRRFGLVPIGYGNYPRSRGEYVNELSRGLAERELPPLARGILSESNAQASSTGITPARAGNTERVTPITCSFRNYPRSRGEYASNAIISEITAELPPLARGIQLPGLFDLIFRGITPARAGNTR